METARTTPRKGVWFAIGAVALTALAIALVALAPPMTTPDATSVSTFRQAVDPIRLGGSDRHVTAATIATDAFPDGAPTVVLARSDVQTDALTGSVLAGALEAPILLTPPTALADATRTALEALGTTRVLVLGGTSAVAESVLADLRESGLDVSRIAGPDRYATAAAVARAATDVQPIGLVDGDRLAFVTSGTASADALSVGGIAYAGPHPIVLAGADDLPSTSLALVEDIVIDRVIIVGGEAVVPDAVEAQLSQLGVPFQRLAGPSRTETSLVVADMALTDFGFSWDRVALVRGDQPVDALSGSPWVGRMRVPTLLVVGPDDLGVPVEDWLAGRCTLAVGLVAFGADAAITPAALARAAALADCVGDPGGPPPTDDDPAAPPGTTQLLTREQQGFGGGVTGWVPRGNVLIGPGTVGRLDDSSMRVEVSEDGLFPDDTGTARAGTTPGLDAVPVTPGTEHTGSWWIRPVGRTSPVRCELRWYDADGAILTTVAGPTVMEEVGQWVQATCSATAPPDAAFVGLRVFVDATAWGDVHHVDDASLLVADAAEPSPTPTPTTSPPAPPPPAPSPPAPPPPAPSGSFPQGPGDTGFAAAGLEEADLTDISSVRLDSGDVLEEVHVRGSVIIEEGATDVVIRRALIETDGRYGIQSAAGVTNLLVEDVTVRGLGGSRSAAILARGQGRIHGVDVAGFRDGIKVFSDMVVEDSWIHDLVLIEGAHRDGIQSVGGTDVTIRNNRIEGPYQQSTSALHLAADNSPISRYTITGNFLSGGTFTVYLRNKDSQPSPTDIVVTDNVFDGLTDEPSPEEPANSWRFGTCSLQQGAGWTVSGNTFLDGSEAQCS